MHAPLHPISQHRLQRFVLLTLALLAWITRVLAGAGASERHWRRLMPLERIARRIKMLVMIAAAEILTRRRKPAPMLSARYGRPVKHQHFKRSIFGSALRRALRHREAGERIGRLIAVLRDLETWAARLARRLNAGLTRYHAQLFCPTDTPLRTLSRPVTQITDSS